MAKAKSKKTRGGAESVYRITELVGTSPVSWEDAVQRPIAVKCIQEKSPVPAWKTKPSWFLLAEKDRMIAPETQRYMAERMGAKIRTHRVDHSPMYTAPDVVVGIILEAARQTLAC